MYSRNVVYFIRQVMEIMQILTSNKSYELEKTRERNKVQALIMIIYYRLYNYGRRDDDEALKYL